LSAPFVSVTDLERCHLAMDECFLLHQEALVAGRPRLALRLLVPFWRMLRLHIRQEEEVLLPAVGAAASDLRWPVRLYAGEHRKLETLLGGIARELWPRRRGMSRREVIELIEREKTFKHVTEHHNLREEQDLFPLADASLAQAERRELTERLHAEWAALLATLQPRIERLRQQLG